MESPLFKSETTKRSLVLAGGGVRLAYHAGVLKALEEANISFNHVDGTSGGIFNTGMLASGLNPDEISNNWRQLNVMDFMSPTPIKNYLKLTRMNAMGDADGIRKKVFPTLGIEVDKIRNNKRFEATFNVCNFSTKEIESINGSQVLEDHLIAGMSLPIFLPSIKINDDWYTDAVWIKDANLMEAVKHGAEEIYLVYCIGNSREYLEGSFLQYVHMIEMSAAGGLLSEFDWLVQINIQLLRGFSAYGQTAPIKVHVIKPTYPLPLDPDLFFGHIDVRGLINMGYADAKKYLATDQNKSENLNYKAVLMAEPGISFQFMANFFGKGKVSSDIEEIAFHLIFDFRKLTDNKLVNSFFGSIVLQKSKTEIGTFNNRVELFSNNGDKQILLSGNFILEGTVRTFSAKITINTFWEFYIALEFKKMEISFDSQPKFTIIQSIKSRLNSILKAKVYQNAGFLAKQRSKKSILKEIYGQ